MKDMEMLTKSEMQTAFLMEKLRYIRKVKGISQKEIAEKLHVSQAVISKMENGLTSTRISRMADYANALGMHLDFVRNDTEPAPKPVEYQLRHYDTPLMQFFFTKEEGMPLQINIASIQKENTAFLPLDLDLNGPDLLRWLKKRILPERREHSRQICKALQSERTDLPALLDTSMFLSLMDSYWIVKEEFTGSFDQYNLFDHRPDTSLAETAFFGSANTADGSIPMQDGFACTPELTTNGRLAKAWRFVDGKYWLYKAGSFGKNYGREPYMEVFASKIGKAMGIPVVEYHLEKWDGKLASVCPLFTDKFTAYIPAGCLLKEGTMSAAAGLYASLGSDFYEHFCSMVVFDALIANEDRHFGNFGFLVDSRTNTIQAPAPLFDHGMSLLYNIDKSQMTTMDAVYEDSLGRWHCTGIDFFKLAQRYIGPVQKRQLDSILHFTLPKEGCPLSKRYLSRLEKTIQKRARRLLELPCTRDAAGI